MAKANEGKWFADFLISEANLYRARGQLNIPLNATVLEPGTLLTNTGTVAGTAGDNVHHILIQRADARAGPVQAAVLSRQAEVNDAYIIWGTVPRNQATYDSLANRLGIIVRFGVVSASVAVLATEEEPPPPEAPPAEPPAPSLRPA